MALPALLLAAMQSPWAAVFIAVEIALPSGTVRLIDGASEVVFGGNTFKGNNATYGTLNAVEDVEELIGAEAPRVRIVINPTDDAAVALWTAVNAQLSTVKIWWGAVDLSTGAVIDTDFIFNGRLDTARIMGTSGSRTVELDVGSAWEYLFQAEEGQKLNDSFHQTCYPGELMFQYVTGVQRQLYWGSHAVGQLGGTTNGFTSNGGAGAGGSSNFTGGVQADYGLAF